jgi:hypothetical protein
VEQNQADETERQEEMQRGDDGDEHVGLQAEGGRA